MARDRRAACRSRRDSRRVADGSANLSRHTFAPSQEERRVAEATARGRLSRLQLARRHLATGVAGRQSRSLADRDHASKQGRHPRRGRLHESLRQRSSKHFLPHRLRSQNPEIRGTLTNPRHRALSGRQKPRMDESKSVSKKLDAVRHTFSDVVPLIEESCALSFALTATLASSTRAELSQSELDNLCQSAYELFRRQNR